MARAYPVTPPTDYGVPPGSEWQALRGELVALLDQVEGQYAQAAPSDSAFAGFAQRMRDLRYQVAETGPDDRHREALRSVKRQIERFNDRGEAEPLTHADNVLQSAIQQIRARTGGIAPGGTPRPPPMAAPQPAAPPPPPPMQPRFDELARSMAGLSGRLEQLEGELRAQRGNASQVREIADQVTQLSHVMELLAGAVGETGQVKRLEGQIAGLAQLIGQAPKVDLSQLNERLDTVAATVDRLADLQVQQIQHAVREADREPPRDAEAIQAMRSIEGSVRTIYDRLDGLESSFAVPPAELERISGALALITSRLGSENARPERLLALVDALNGRINELETRSDALGSLRDDIEGLRNAVVGAMEPRFSALESQLGTLGERLATQTGTDAPPGMPQVEAQIRQLVARMDQTGEQLAELARLYNEPAQPAAVPDFEALANLAAARSAEAVQQRQQPVPDFEALANLAAARTSAALQRPEPDFEALAGMAATRTSEILAQQEKDTRPTVSEHSLAQFEARITRLVETLTKTRSPEGLSGMQEGFSRVEDRLARLEESLRARPVEAAAAATAAPAMRVPAAAKAAPRPTAPVLPPAPPYAEPAEDAMPRNPGAEAPLTEFGFPDLGPVRAALEAKNGPRKLHPGINDADEPGFDVMPITPEMAGGTSRDKSAASAMATPPSFDPATVARPPRPESSLNALTDSAISAPVQTGADAPAASRNTFIEAARRAAQRQSAPRAADPNSLIGKALARFQPGSGAGKPATPTVGKLAETPVQPIRIPEPVPPQQVAPKRPSPMGGLLGREPKVAPVPPTPEPVPDALTASAAPGIADEPKQSFLLKYRKPILLVACLVAISFMTLNLVMQRLAANSNSSTNTPVVAVPAAPAPAATDTAAPPAAAAKPVSELTTPAEPETAAEPIETTAAGPGPRIIPTDPVTTASINPGTAMSFAPATGANVMPPALAAANSQAAGTSDAPIAGPGVELASLPADAAAAQPADIPAAPQTDTATADPATPATLDSPVEVELPPDALGPLDLRQAAANGNAQAQFEIAAIYSEGRAVPQDFKQADVWYERAAAQGFGPAQYRLGNLYETGSGVGKDLEQARLWYQRAAEAGNRMAMHNLAALYAGGQFGKQDFASAAQWFERAADLGMKDSQFNLGMLYARGLGVPQNLETSYKWFALAATGGDAEAAKARDNVGRSLDAEALKRASDAVAAWKVGTVNLVANFAPLGTWEKTFNPGPAITNKDVVMKVQVALMRLGYDVGTPDGHMGPKTGVAIKAFEQGTGMSQVGQINPRLLAVLGSQPV